MTANNEGHVQDISEVHVLIQEAAGNVLEDFGTKTGTDIKMHYAMVEIKTGDKVGSRLTSTVTSAKSKDEEQVAVQLSNETIESLRKAYISQADPSVPQILQLLLTLTVKVSTFRKEMSLINVEYKP
jgi:hypothetical protein